MDAVDRLKAEAAARCTLKLRDRVALAGTTLTGVIVQDGGYGYFKIKLDGGGRRVIRRFTDLTPIPGA